MIAIDCEWNNKLELLAISYWRDENDNGFISGDSPDIVPFISSLAESNELVIGHNIKSDLLCILENTGIEIYNVFDTMIAWQLLTKGKGYPATLAYVTKALLNVSLEKDLQIAWLKKYDYNFSQELIDYSINDVKYLIPLKAKLEVLMNKFKLNVTNDLGINLFEVEMKVLPVLAIIENTPKYVDVKKLTAINEEWTNTVNKHKKECYSILGSLGYSYVKLYSKLKGKKFVLEYINLNSPKQIKDIFKYYGIKLPKSKDNKETIGKELLMQFNELNPNNVLYNFVNSYIKYKEYGKLLSYYGDKFIDNLKEGKYASTEYSQCFTATGRLSSKGNKLRKWTINMQNIPANTEDGKKLMACFMAEEGYMYIGSDLAGAELRLAASFSQDELLLDSFNKGVDFHSELATCTWQAIHKNDEVVTKKTMWNGDSFRTTHKRINFGVLYGGSHKRIAQILNIKEPVAKKAYGLIEKKVNKLMTYLKGNAEKAKRDGYLVTKSNRIKYNLSMTEAFNYEIQEANATAMKIALYLIHNYIRENNIDAKIVNTVHDAVYLVVREWTDVTFVKELMKEALQVFLKGVEADSDLIITKYWSK